MSFNMDGSSLKRPLDADLPSRETLAAVFSNFAGDGKKRKTSTSTPRYNESALSQQTATSPKITSQRMIELADNKGIQSSEPNVQRTPNLATFSSFATQLLPPLINNTKAKINSSVGLTASNSLPQNAVPIIPAPLTVADFYSDLTTPNTKHTDPGLSSQQVQSILNRFPPPPVPFLHRKPKHADTFGKLSKIHHPYGGDDDDEYDPFRYDDDFSDEDDEEDDDDDEDENDGVMVPFIYPPPPSIKADFDPEDYRNTLKWKREMLEWQRDQDRRQELQQPSQSETNPERESDMSLEQPALQNESTADAEADKSTPAPADNQASAVKAEEIDTSSKHEQKQQDNEEQEQSDQQEQQEQHELQDSQAPPPPPPSHHSAYPAVVPPLPFPPPNYMPYVLRTDQASLTPSEVFHRLIKASRHLPRIDMVVASAAGSLFDIKDQVLSERFSVQKHEEWARKFGPSRENGKRTSTAGSTGSGSAPGSAGSTIGSNTTDSGLPKKKKLRGRPRGSRNKSSLDQASSTPAVSTPLRISSQASQLDGSNTMDEQSSQQSQQERLATSKRGSQISHDDDGLFSEYDDYDEDGNLLVRAEDYDDDVDTEALQDYFDYASNVDVSSAYHENAPDAEDGPPSLNQFPISRVPEDYTHIYSKTSSRGALRKEGLKSIKSYLEPAEFKQDEPFASNVPKRPKGIYNMSGRDVISTTGNNKDRRRDELHKSMDQLSNFEEENRHQLYLQRKQRLLDRLQNLKASKINFTDDATDIKDDELRSLADKLKTRRDDELLRLKIYSNYELLKASMVFYEDSNRYYKNMNSISISKLSKLKNFFEFQKQTFDDILKNESAELFDIKSKESAKLYSGISKQDYNSDIKAILRASLADGPSMAANLSHAPIDQLAGELPTFNDDSSGVASSSFTAPPSSSGHNFSNGHKRPFSSASSSASGSASSTDTPLLIHDFMPLITSEEFDLITGDLPSKSKSMSSKESNATKQKNAINIKHKIFQSPLYDRTSGSDTNSTASFPMGGNGNGSDSGGSSTTTPVKRRPGRRSAAENASNGGGGGAGKDDDPDKQHTEAALLAKIMKQFVGPMPAKSDELTNDLGMMGVKTRWPINK